MDNLKVNVYVFFLFVQECCECLSTSEFDSRGSVA